MDKAIYWIWFQLVFGMGTRRSELFQNYFAHPREIWESLEEGGRARGMLSEKELAACAPSMEQAKNLHERTLRKGCFAVTPEMPEYPPLLRHIYARPAVLYGKGDLSCLADISIAMVGTRKYSPYGEKAAQRLTGGLSEAGITIVSGLAQGIDTICHREAVKRNAPTVGVMGCGLDIDYPKGNSSLKTAIVEAGGAVVSEYPLGVSPRPENFPIRNRIIAGMCKGTVVVEADLSSGSMITAHHALEQGRDVFAVPGDIFSSRQQGVNALLKEGAKLADSAESILEEYGIGSGEKFRPVYHQPEDGTILLENESPAPKPPPDRLPEELSEEAERLLDAMGGESVSLEHLAAAAGLDVQDVQAALTELEIYGLVQALPGRRFLRAGRICEKV